MHRLSGLLVCIFGFVCLLVAAWLWFIPRIEDDLTERAEVELAASGVTEVTVTFDGRNGSTSGAASEPAADRLDGSLRGSRWVRADGAIVAGTSTTATSTPETTAAPSTTVAPSTTAAPTTTAAPGVSQPAMIRIVRDGSRLVIDGTVATEQDRTTLLDAASAAGFEPDDRLVVDDATEQTPAVAHAATLIDPLFAGATDSELSLAGDQILVTGTAEDPVAADAIDLAAGRVSADGADVELDLETRELSVDEQVVALQAELDQVFELARRIQPESPNFETARDDLNDAAVDILDRVTVSMRRYPLPVVEIVGHTDSRGSIATNQELSVERATSVLDHLVDAGVDAERLTAVGRGEFEPVESNASVEGRLENRRVNFLVRKN